MEIIVFTTVHKIKVHISSISVFKLLKSNKYINKIPSFPFNISYQFRNLFSYKDKVFKFDNYRFIVTFSL